MFAKTQGNYCKGSTGISLLFEVKSVWGLFENPAQELPFTCHYWDSKFHSPLPFHVPIPPTWLSLQVKRKVRHDGQCPLLTIAGPWNKSNNGKIHNGSQTCLSGLLDEGWMPEWCKHELLMGVGRWRSMRLTSTVFMCSFPLQVLNVAKKLLELRLVNRLA